MSAIVVDKFWTIQVELYLLKWKLSHLFLSHEEDRRRNGEISPRTDVPVAVGRVKKPS